MDNLVQKTLEVTWFREMVILYVQLGKRVFLATELDCYGLSVQLCNGNVRIVNINDLNIAPLIDVIHFQRNISAHVIQRINDAILRHPLDIRKILQRYMWVKFCYRSFKHFRTHYTGFNLACVNEQKLAPTQTHSTMQQIALLNITALLVITSIGYIIATCVLAVKKLNRPQRWYQTYFEETFVG